MDTLHSTKPHYIRCVKPNNTLKPAVYDNICVLRQLRSGGVLEAIKIKCGGFPAQIPFEEFLTRFLILAPEVLNGSYEQNVACKWILEKMEIEGYQIGKTKVFLRSGHMHDLDAHKARLLKNSAQTIQRKMKTRFTRKHFLSMRRASVRVQTYWRGESSAWTAHGSWLLCLKEFTYRKMARKFYKELKIEKRERSAIHIQKDMRRLTARRTFKSSRSSAVVLQAGVRADCARRELKFRRRSRAATMIQASWRGHVVFSNYKNIRRAAQKGLPVSKMNSLLRTNGQRIHILENTVIESDPLPAKEQEVAEKKTDKTPVEEKKQKKIKVQENKVDKVNVSREGKKVQVARSTTVQEREIPLQDDDDKVKGLSEEVQNLKALLHELERKYAVAQEASDERQKRAKEMEEKVNNLQVFLKRMIYSMSDQFTEMKSILHTFSNSSSNSDAAAAVNMSNLSPHAINAMVHDISGVDISGSARSGSKKEGAFDVF